MATKEDKLNQTLKKFGKGWASDVSAAGLLTRSHHDWRTKFWFDNFADTKGTDADPPARTILTDVSAPSADWCKALVKFAANEKGRYALNSIDIEFHAGGVRFTATDGRKLTSQVFGDTKTPVVAGPFHVNADALAFVWDVLEKAGGKGGHPELGYAPIKQTVNKAIADGTQNVYDRHGYGKRTETKYRYEDVQEDTFALVLQTRGGYNGVACVATIDRADGEYPAWRDVVPSPDYQFHLPADFFRAVEVLKGTTRPESAGMKIEAVTDWADPETRKPIAPRLTLRTRHLFPRVDAVCELGDLERDKKFKDIVFALDPTYLTLVWGLMQTKYPVLQNNTDVVMKYTDKDTGVLFVLDVGSLYLVMPIDL